MTKGSVVVSERAVAKGQGGCWGKVTMSSPLANTPSPSANTLSFSKHPFLQQTPFPSANTLSSPLFFPLSSRAKPRDLQFRGPFLETRNLVLSQNCHLDRSGETCGFFLPMTKAEACNQIPLLQQRQYPERAHLRKDALRSVPQWVNLQESVPPAQPPPVRPAG
jgi:hypothetical protein